MTSTMNNLDKLIQMVTIEQMYNMLDRLKQNTVSESVDNSVFEKYDKIHSDLYSKLESLNQRVCDIQKTMESFIVNLNKKVDYLSAELHENKDAINNNSKFLCQQIRGQQKLTSFSGFSVGNPDSEAKDSNVVLSIAECTTEVEEVENDVVQAEEVEVETEEVEVDTEVEKEVEKEVEQNDDLEEEQSEEEVGTEDGEEEVEVEEEVEEEVEAEAEEDEEEVFEIEIDDVTYFATSEENGILYESTADGDVGKKVGVIKDGEPIFD